MRRIHYNASIAALIFLILIGAPPSSRGEHIRKPVWAGRFYPATRAKLTASIKDLTRDARPTTVDVPEGKTLRALILPHAGYIYSGWTAAHASRVLTHGQFSKVILIGPDHRVGFRNGAISDARSWETPLGLIRVHTDAPRLLRYTSRFKTVSASDRKEHSLEVVLPFLQYYLGEFKLVPIVLGPGDVKRLSSDIDAIMDEKTLLAVSSDLSHYLPYQTAVSRDRDTIEMILDLAIEKLAGRDNCACGLMPILITLDLARKHGWQPYLIHYTNSGDTAGDKDRVVGYAAIGFYGDAMDNEAHAHQKYSRTNGQVLVRLARRTIMEKLGQQVSVDTADTELLADSRFDTRLGTFVTLTIDGQLRGCIGSLEATEPIREGVRHNAANAAFRDPRFPALTGEELDRVDIEVSILTKPEPLDYRGHRDLLDKLRVDVDGVIIEKDGRRATFLPQVWKQLPEPGEFLSHLCMKARLPADAWKRPGLDVFTYQVQYFEEHR